MKFKIDENLPFILKKLIEKEGNFEVDSVYYEGLAGITDIRLLEVCFKEKRILITLDTDFITTDQSHYGIIILRSRKQGKNAIRALFTDFLNNFTLEESKKKITIIEPTQIRIRND
ncbi:MAG: hypothetical protein GF317_23730 [Candidatus Lokiarchaeota archaeon]|nr:hypothetical protein [Candidatus Lokiarchaeota archaeon]MBD3202381.1 hypothetical protein [Candidatus Lokiarchaeota archaeon]